MPLLEPQDLLSNKTFKCWLGDGEKPKSSFLLIRGLTKALHNAPLSWASQASVETIRLLSDKNAI